MKFTKPPLTILEKIALLQERGLQMSDTERVANYLNHIGYFRLTGYFKYYQNTETNQFYDETSFDKVLDLYIFDRKLRLLVLDAIEKIEVSIKAQIEEVMSNKYGCFWYTEKEHFALETAGEAGKYDRFMDKAKETKELSTLTFVQAYNEKYFEEEFLPSRMVMESCTIWGVSRIFSLINGEDAKEIATTYNTYYVDLRKWLQLVVNVRNISAHQERLRNRRFITKPRVNDVIFREKYQLQETEWKIEVAPTMFNVVLIIQYLLECISPNNDWLERLEALFVEYPDISKEAMGFFENWEEKFS